MFKKQLSDIDSRHLRRHLTTVESRTGPLVEIDGRPMLLFASNDYLGLAGNPDVVQAAVEATKTYGAGAGAARLVSGSLPPHEEMEQALARFKATAAAITFGSGYLANVGTIPALIGKGGLILADRLCHASLIDGCRLSGADFRVYRHCDLEHLESLLARRGRPSKTLIVTDGVFSMDGDLAPLPELVRLGRAYGADLYVDDAHGTGVMGKNGRGTIEHFKLDTEIPFHMGTLSKALGSTGGYIAGSSSIRDYLMNACRSFIFTTAPTPGSARAVTAALKIVQREPERRARLWSNRDRLFAGLRAHGFSIPASTSPIIPILIGDAAKAVAFAGQLRKHGVFAPAIRPPTVPDSTSRIRVTVTSEHSIAQIDEAIEAFRRAGEATGVL